MNQLIKFKALLQKELNFETGGSVYIESTSVFNSGFKSRLMVVLENTKKEHLTIDIDNYYSEELLSIDIEELFRKAHNKENRYNIPYPTVERTMIHETDVICEIIKYIRKAKWGGLYHIKPIAKITLEELFDVIREESNWKPAAVTRDGNLPYKTVSNTFKPLIDTILEKRLVGIYKQYKP